MSQLVHSFIAPRRCSINRGRVDRRCHVHRGWGCRGRVFLNRRRQVSGPVAQLPPAPAAENATAAAPRTSALLIANPSSGCVVSRPHIQPTSSRLVRAFSVREIAWSHAARAALRRLQVCQSENVIVGGPYLVPNEPITLKGAVNCEFENQLFPVFLATGIQFRHCRKCNTSHHLCRVYYAPGQSENVLSAARMSSHRNGLSIYQIAASERSCESCGCQFEDTAA
jgi:hypothetical protein